MTTLLLFGILLGMRHAFEADHVAAVATLTSRSPTLKHALKQGAVWGIGHTLSLFLFGSIVLWMDTVVPDTLAHTLELIVGIMLVILGIDVIRRLIRDRIHFHHHKHDKIEHFHAHSHAHEGPHKTSPHNHQHNDTFPIRSLLVGLMHGMAGSAALILLTLNTLQSPWMGMIYIALFGAGSIIGMAILSFAIAIPLHFSAKSLTWFHNGLQAIVGVFTIGLGLHIVYQMGGGF